jgi:hypothetical protein
MEFNGYRSHAITGQHDRAALERAAGISMLTG